MSVVAPSAEDALTEARLTVKDQTAGVEVWDETGLVLQRKNSLAPNAESAIYRQPTSDDTGCECA